MKSIDLTMTINSTEYVPRQHTSLYHFDILLFTIYPFDAKSLSLSFFYWKVLSPSEMSLNFLCLFLFIPSSSIHPLNSWNKGSFEILKTLNFTGKAFLHCSLCTLTSDFSWVNWRGKIRNLKPVWMFFRAPFFAVCFIDLTFWLFFAKFFHYFHRSSCSSPRKRQFDLGKETKNMSPSLAV